MQGTREGHLSLPEEYWKWIYANYRKYGYRYPAQFVRELILYAIKSNPKYRNPNSESTKELEKIDEIGRIASERRGVKFSLVNAVDDYLEDKKGLDKALKMKWIAQKDYDAQLKKSEDHHKEVIRIELSKKHEEEPSEEMSSEEIKAKVRANLKREKEMEDEAINDDKCPKCGSRMRFSPDRIMGMCTNREECGYMWSKRRVVRNA